MGSDALGRDWFTRIMYGGRLSLTIGLIGQVMTIVFGTVLGVMSGFYGGAVDQVIQRTTEFLNAFPQIPLFMALAAAIPTFWSPLARSEERRVGKECRSRWSAYHDKKNRTE